MTRSSDCRLRSTIQSTFPSVRVSGSASASQMFPSSSSASPSSEMNRPPVEAPKLRLREPVGERTEQRRGRAEPDRAGRVVDRKRVLRPRRIRLQPAEVPQPRQVGAVEPPEQVLDRVQHRRGVRFHRDPVLGAEVGEVERRHQRHHRRRRRLMPAHLELVALRALPVRIVDDPHREPQHPPLDRLERRDVDTCILELVRRHGIYSCVKRDKGGDGDAAVARRASLRASTLQPGDSRPVAGSGDRLRLPFDLCDRFEQYGAVDITVVDSK